MKSWKFVAILSFMLMIIVGGVLGYKYITIQQELVDTQVNLTNVQNVLEGTQVQLIIAEQNVSNLSIQLTTSQQNLAGIRTQLTTTEQNLVNVRGQLVTAEQTIVDKQLEINQKQIELNNINYKLSALTGLPSPIINVGVEFEYCTMVDGSDRDIVLIGNPNATNPTYDELIMFLSNDNTHEQVYSYPSFVCSNFAEMLYFHAEKAGINAGYVNLKLSSYISSYISGCGYSSGGFHACNVFNTVDRGLVFIDDTGTLEGDGEPTTVDISIGKLYQPISIFSNTDWCPMGYVSDYSIVW